MSIIAEFLTTTPRTTTDRLRAGTATTPRASTSSTCPTVGCRRWPTQCPGTLGMSRMWSTPERLSTLLSLPVVTRADARYRQWWQDEDGRIHSSIIVLKKLKYLINCWKDLVQSQEARLHLVCYFFNIRWKHLLPGFPRIIVPCPKFRVFRRKPQS